MTRTHDLLTLCVALGALAGCAHDRVRERTSVSAVTNEEATGDRDEPGKTRMHYTVVGEDVALNRTDDQGNATDANSTLAEGDANSADCQRAVFFQTDSAQLDDEARGQLTHVAECIKRHDVDHALVTGRADPRGTEEHNRELGMKRAEAVANYLRSLGVPEGDIRVRSKGETASASEEELWPAERRAGVSTQ